MEKIKIACLEKTGEDYYKHTVLFNKQELASFLPDFSSYKQDEFFELIVVPNVQDQKIKMNIIESLPISQNNFNENKSKQVLIK